MCSKKILLVGDGNHQFITNLVIWLTKVERNGLHIDVLSTTPVSAENRQYYKEIHRIKDSTITYNTINKVKAIRRFYRHFLYKKLVRELPHYDIINFHYLTVDSYFLVEEFKKYNLSKIILSIWGSDFYRISNKNESNFLKTCLNADKISFTNKTTIELFKEKYSWTRDNLFLCRFGLAPLETLKIMHDSKIECKKTLGWSTNKLAIVLGYNLSPAQQHIQILDLLSHDVFKEYKDNIELIVPITYGGDKNYKRILLQKLRELPFESIVYDTFLSDDKVAYIRKSADVMLQLQKTDQFSGSMQEHLYAGNVVITGSWLPYETLKKEGVWFIEIDKIRELLEVLPDILTSYKNYEENTIHNSQAIDKLSSWGNNIQDWLMLYNK